MPRVTVGVPAYNESRNIVNLLRSLEAQSLHITEVIVSDDSSDLTPSLVRDFILGSSLDITILHHESRRGAAAAWNEILHNAAGDVVVLYDADTIPHPSCTERLVSRLVDKTVLCSSNPKPTQSAGISGSASEFISNWLRSVRKTGMSQYTVMGRGLAIEAATGRKIKIPEDVISIDLYLQLNVIEMGLDVAYNDDAVVYFKPPSSVQDLASQVVRAIIGHKQINEMASRLVISLPARVAAMQALKNAAADPIGAISTIIAYSLIPFHKLRINDADSAIWHIAQSSKEIDYQQLKTRF